MINKKYLKLLREKNKFNTNYFIYETISKRIIDSLDLVNINFSDILEIGINENLSYNYVKKRFPKSNFKRSDVCDSKLINNKLSDFLKIDLDNIKFGINKYDLIYSNFILHLTNDLEKTFKLLNQCLKPSGLIIAAIPDIDNIYQLVNSMYKTDFELYSGAYQRINPTKTVDSILSILKKQNFDIPTVSKDIVKIEYSNFKNLLKDVKATNLSYCYNDKRKKIENKNYFSRLEKNYKNDYFKECYELDIRINIISAWKSN